MRNLVTAAILGLVLTVSGLLATADTGPERGSDSRGSTRFVQGTSASALTVTTCDVMAVNTPSHCEAGVLLDSLLWVAGGDLGLFVFNVRYSFAPVRVGEVNTLGYATNLSVQGSMAAVADYHWGLSLVDISVPTHPVVLGTLPSIWSAMDVQLVDTLAYVVTSSGFKIVNVAQPHSPVVVGSLPGVCCGLDLQVVGQTAFMARGSFGFSVIDVSNVTAPVLIAIHDTPGFANDIQIAGDTAYLSDGPQGVQILLVTDPAVPVPLGTVPCTDAHETVKIDSLLYVADGTAGVRIWDVSDVLAPVLAGSVPKSFVPGALSLVVGPGRVFAMEQSGLTMASVFRDDVATCGNGVVEPGEPCDDGNLVWGDGCDPCCQLTRPPRVCGNGNVELYEPCDDGNAISADGCANDCTIEPAVCGNGVVEFQEECDDGNQQSNDECNGCTAAPVCGNGLLEPFEDCDDGNTDPYDGCDNCEARPVCGDSLVDFNEECDDGNRSPGDGCDAACQYEHTCGDGTLELGEECDDGNFDPLDGCNPVCEIENCRIQVTGDVNNSNTRTSADIITILSFCFKNGPAPQPCLAAGDVNCSGTVTSGDVIFMVNLVFKGGPAPCDICNQSVLATYCN